MSIDYCWVVCNLCLMPFVPMNDKQNICIKCLVNDQSIEGRKGAKHFENLKRRYKQLQEEIIENDYLALKKEVLKYRLKECKDGKEKEKIEKELYKLNTFGELHLKLVKKSTLYTRDIKATLEDMRKEVEIEKEVNEEDILKSLL